MNPFDLQTAFGMDQVSATHVGEILLRLLVAVVLGALVAYRPWRRLMRGVPPPAIESAQAQTLIAAAGALMVAVIGDSMARAFGLVGLGAFIRFRSGIKDPRDAAVMFVMIGIGMACGLGAVPIAAIATGFVGMVLATFDASGRVRPRRLRVGITVAEPRAVVGELRAAFESARVLEVPGPGPEAGKIVIEVDASEELDAARVLEILEARGVKGVSAVAVEEE